MKASRVHVRTGGWQAWLDLVVAAAVVGLPLYRGHSVVLVLPAAGILTVFAVWRWLSDAEVSFDADGVRVSDSYWRLLRREPILFPYAEGIEIVAESGGGFGVAWVNGLRIAAASRAAARLETAARNLQLPFRRVDISIATASPTILLLAAIPSRLPGPWSARLADLLRAVRLRIGRGAHPVYPRPSSVGSQRGASGRL
jgi:hypothetical protein